MDSLQGASYAGLAFSCWEILITFEDEIDLMWASSTRRVTVVKVLYFFSRYFGLAVQITNTVISGMLKRRYPVPQETCRLSLAYQVFTIFLLIGSVDVILMIRVYAFYRRKRWVGWLMVFLFFFRVGLSSASAIMTVPTQEFNEICLTDTVPSVVMYFFIMGEFVFQSIIIGLTFFKQFMAFRAGWARTPLVTLLCRDGATTYTVIIAALIGTAIYGRIVYWHESAHFVFPALVSLMSSVGCRLIIGMQKLVPHRDAPEPSMSQDTQEFTTIIDSLWTRSHSNRTPQARTTSVRTPSVVSGV